MTCLPAANTPKLSHIGDFSAVRPENIDGRSSGFLNLVEWLQEEFTKLGALVRSVLAIVTINIGNHWKGRIDCDIVGRDCKFKGDNRFDDIEWNAVNLVRTLHQCAKQFLPPHFEHDFRLSIHFSLLKSVDRVFHHSKTGGNLHDWLLRLRRKDANQGALHFQPRCPGLIACAAREVKGCRHRKQRPDSTHPRSPISNFEPQKNRTSSHA